MLNEFNEFLFSCSLCYAHLDSMCLFHCPNGNKLITFQQKVPEFFKLIRYVDMIHNNRNLIAILDFVLIKSTAITYELSILEVKDCEYDFLIA